MTPVIPSGPHANGTVRILAGELMDPLVASIDPDGLVLTEWEPTAEDLAVLLAGGRVRLWVATGNQPWQPVFLEAGE